MRAMRAVQFIWCVQAASAARVVTEDVSDFMLDTTASVQTAARRRSSNYHPVAPPPGPSPPVPPQVHSPAPLGVHPNCQDTNDIGDSGGYHCSYYVESDCGGEFDTAEFTAASSCCICGGGFQATTITTTTTTTTDQSPVTVQVQQGGQLTLEVQGIGKLTVELERDGQLTVDNQTVDHQPRVPIPSPSPAPPPLSPTPPPPPPPPLPPRPSCLNEAAFHSGHMVNGNAPASNADECSRQCLLQADCLYWDYGQRYCRLRDGSGSQGSIHSPGYISGERGCLLG